MSENKESYELSKAQLERQDFVDNSIFDLVKSLIPEQFENSKLERNLNWISEIRLNIEDLLLEQLVLKEDAAKSNKFSMLYYPFIPDEYVDFNAPYSTYFDSESKIKLSVKDEFWELLVDGIKRASGKFIEEKTIIEFTDGQLKEEVINNLISLHVH